MADEALAPLPRPFFHQPSGAVRFWVPMLGGRPMGAILSKEVLRYRFDAQPDGSDAVAVYEAHRGEIDATSNLDAGRVVIAEVVDVIQDGVSVVAAFPASARADL